MNLQLYFPFLITDYQSIHDGLEDRSYKSYSKKEDRPLAPNDRAYPVFEQHR